ncbi:MAG TPA: VOC family protein [Vicinamibacterales bacterium]|nr:VOC family protein [Vicinamibacterales bacterium]
MAIRKAARAKSTAARARSGNKTTKKPSKRKSAAARRNRRKSEPETLRLRSMNPLFTVTDLERSVRFYTDVLGFIVGQRYPGSDGTLQGVMLKAGNCDLGLSQDDWAKGRDRQRGVGVRVWCTTVQDIDALAKRIKARGYPLTQEPKDESSGGRSLTLDDPDGFHLSIHRPA